MGRASVADRASGHPKLLQVSRFDGQPVARRAAVGTQHTVLGIDAAVEGQAFDAHMVVEIFEVTQMPDRGTDLAADLRGAMQ